MDVERLIPILLLAVLLLGFRTARHGERVIVFRLGRLLDIKRPGRFWILPFIDKTARIYLDAHIPNWRSLDPAEVDRRVEQLASLSKLRTP